jgi:hypothetical protein
MPLLQGKDPINTGTSPSHARLRRTSDVILPNQEKLFLFVSVLAQAFFPLVRRHFMSFSFFSAGHGKFFKR